MLLHTVVLPLQPNQVILRQREDLNSSILVTYRRLQNRVGHPHVSCITIRSLLVIRLLEYAQEYSPLHPHALFINGVDTTVLVMLYSCWSMLHQPNRW